MSRTEYDELLAGLPDGLTPREAAILMQEQLSDAVQAQRPWAVDRLNQAQLNGLAAEYSRYKRRTMPQVATKRGPVALGGGVQRVDERGKTRNVQVSFLDATFDELAQHRARMVATKNALNVNARIQAQLLSLREQAPSARTPREAMAALNMSADKLFAVLAS